MTLLPAPLERPLRTIQFRLTRRLKDRHPHQIWPGIESVAVTIRPLVGRFGNVKQHELLTLCAVVRHIDARRLFEFGTFDGQTTWHLAANSGPEARVLTLDLPPDHPARRNPKHDRTVGSIFGVGVAGQYANTSEAGKIEQLYGDSLEFDPEPYRGQIDFCFIDASHEYRHVQRDTTNARIMVRPGGAIFWHDYSRWWPGVQKCLDELSDRLPVYRIPNSSLGVLRVPD